MKEIKVMRTLINSEEGALLKRHFPLHSFPLAMILVSLSGKQDRPMQKTIGGVGVRFVFFFFFTYPNISNHYKFWPLEQWKIAWILGNLKLVLPLIIFYDHGFYEAANFDVESFMNAIEILHKYFPPNF